jgi:hypothetical protein
MQIRFLVLLIAAFSVGAVAPNAGAITADAFGASGGGGRVNGQTLAIGASGLVDELDAWLRIEGQDLNGAAAGVTAQLSTDALPAGLALTFSATLSGDGSDLVLRYVFTNGTGADLASLTFLSFVDAEIAEATTTFFNEYATTSGSLAAGQASEADEPGYAFGDISLNLRSGVLDGINAVPTSAPDDVSLALSFVLGPLAGGASAAVDILLSEDGDRLGSFAFTQRDTIDTSTVITYSGAVVPEPGTALLVVAGLAALAGRSRRLA